MKNLLQAILILLIASILFSCNKDEDPDANLTREEMLAGESSKNWKLVKSEIVGFGSSDIKTCNADDVYTFTRDGAFNFDEGGTKCDDSDPQNTIGTWRFNDDKTEVIRGEGGFEITSKIISLSSNTLVLETNFLLLIRETYNKK